VLGQESAKFKLRMKCLGRRVQNLSLEFMKRENQQDATIRCLLLTSVSTCIGHHYAYLQEIKGPVTAFGVLFWFCWMWLHGHRNLKLRIYITSRRNTGN